MARYRGSRVKVIRRLGLLPGFTSKSSNKPQNNNKQLSQYGFHLQEKQKLRYNYGISEHELIKYVKSARRKRGNSGDKLLQLLEMRLDTLLYRTGFVPTVASARQLISHGHINVNGKKVDIPGFNCSISDKIVINKEILKSLNDKNNSFSTLNCSHLVLNELNNDLTITVTNLPDIQVLGYSINILLVLEYYSGK
ncbi:30S ribosomal protein S4 (plastid) [Bigelowiella natans]|uniref:Small ribosomal subunit protein uS4c n=1 Tax=Bigelowiella natans TaxID=227086 RepID=RR4_BIGNA|nr:30S ribosomal protein S4 [Bigelowiella natans]Q06J34.1 RecName: Full=Small ribosomal subunit protein uS4c; AltName: Full=30S ribosomal protein S4, chloroplastic [Bigelowiella natans]ABG91425.1 30S ribosomal protein S4 [Bigelowiella natans]